MKIRWFLISLINFIGGYISFVWFGINIMVITNTGKPNNPDGEIMVPFGIVIVLLSLMFIFLFEKFLYKKSLLSLKIFSVSQFIVYIFGLATHIFIVSVVLQQKIF